LDIWRSLLDVPDHEHRVLRGRDASHIPDNDGFC